MRPAVEINSLSKIFDINRGAPPSLKGSLLSFKKPKKEKLYALNNINLNIMHSETVALIGKNGSGKSTLLRVIGKIYKPTIGSVIVDGRISSMLDLGAGFHPELTGRENIFFNSAIMGLSSAKTRERLEQIIEFSELSDFIDTPVRTYSAGMLMRLGFSIAIETDPDVILIDEVLAVGDAAFQEKCYDKIEVFKNTGKTIIFVTHDLQAAKYVASRTIWLQKGDIVADGDTLDTIDKYLATVPKHEHPI